VSPADIGTAALIVSGLFFYVAGSVGVLRFPDAHSRLHALTKADNLGLGLIVLGLCLQAQGLLAAAKLVLVWVFAIAAAATAAQLVARVALSPGNRPEKPK
jgi:multicomponent Na+:H+ antiporter subunit G